jgi:hypothetical protein
VDEEQVFLLSGDPPSFVTFLAHADWWVRLLAGYAALYVAELVKEAAKDTWKNRARTMSIVKAAGNRIRRFAEGVGQLRGRLSPRTAIAVGLPTPTPFDSTRLTLQGSDTDELALQLSLFVHHLPAVGAFIEAEGLDRERVATAIILKLLDDGSLEVWWQDNDTFEERTHTIRLDAV